MTPAATVTREASRASLPELAGRVTRDGVSIAYEVHGHGPQTVLLLPAWSVIHSRMWKLQVPYLARHFRVITFDGRGNGASDRPPGGESYTVSEFAEDAIAVMDATETASATLVGLSCGALWGVVAANEHPERVERLACLSPSVSLAPNHPERDEYPFDEPLSTDEGWAKYNSYYWARAYHGFLEFFAAQCLSEPHSTKPVEDFVAWGLGTTPEILADTTRGIIIGEGERWRERCAEVSCPVLVVHGDDDRIRPHAQGAALAAETGGELVTLTGAGHLPNVRHPVKINRLLRDFIAPARPPRGWTLASARPRRALYVSSPIGLGHARRDLAIVRELRRLHPDLQIDWLAQHPLTAMLESAGEQIHPASADLVSEAGHVESEAGEHRLDCFETIRRMDEIMLANFMVFHDLVSEEPYEIWIGDEAWEVDYFLHENPELKTAPYVWLTDFVGWLAMPDGGRREAELVSDLNAEMIEHVERYPALRDRAIFVGEPEDVVTGQFGPGLPAIREWTEAHYRFSGYITGTDRRQPEDRAALRAELGYAPDEPICLVAVGGSAVGRPLLRRVIQALPEARQLVPGLRMVAVTGPRIDPRSLPAQDGLEVLGYVEQLDRHLAAGDMAIVQGGLTTCMELVAAGRPFVSIPLAHHFEQRGHVRHRLERYGHTQQLEYGDATPSAIAGAIARGIGRKPDYRPVDSDGAARAAAIIAELL